MQSHAMYEMIVVYTASSESRYERRGETKTFFAIYLRAVRSARQINGAIGLIFTGRSVAKALYTWKYRKSAISPRDLERLSAASKSDIPTKLT